ncbi:hypothetical protein A3D85_00390 [Candidatus Amesbacteria bacterium RIFCSPHIGHO2_02_FULL_47_9]|nr:MAG: hypothetical protein A3D85_00390 [Candidatus Amesbacteria bacterium RIFCSPHIGHO2_02_FULL_47_9]OGD07387.1 MAG: hypothetical protein A2899_03735 [Candidatus Amesbacteria bacterium RIFCSPLOWO2_01_FULL_49_25]
MKQKKNHHPKSSPLRRFPWLIPLAFLSALSLFYIFSRATPPSGQPPITTSTPTPLPTFTPYTPNPYEQIIYEDPDKNYSIVFHPQTQNYVISIIGSPFAQYRMEAEKMFLFQTRLSPAQACQLDVTMAAFYVTNPEESKQNYRLSFCLPTP